MRVLPVLAVAAVIAACVQKETPVAECVSPAPPAGLDPAKDAEGALRYARQLSFYPGTAPYGERRALTVIATPGTPLERRFALGAEVEIQPERCTHLNDTTALTGGGGRIVARLVANAPYQKLGLPQDTSYLWIDSLALRGQAGTARGVIVSAGAQPFAVRRVRVEYHPDAGARGWPEGRLLFDPDDDQLWVSCVMFGCCYLEGGEPPSGPG